MREQTFAYRFTPRCAVFAHSDRPPTAAEWSRVLDAYRRQPDAQRSGVLVYTDGGAPNASQRAELTAAFAGRKPRVAVLTKSVLAKMAGKALSLFGNYRFFDSDHVEAALDYLELSGGDRSAALRALNELRKELSIVRAS